MACSRGKANPSRVTERRLWSDAAGRCQNPECVQGLFHDAGAKFVHVGEMAHVLAANEDGPRGKADVSAEELGAYENLILLCANCHTIVDKAPEDYPVDRLLEWKQRHRQRIDEVFGTVEYPTREAARLGLEPLLEHNRAVFDAFGPHNDYSDNPESEQADVWKRKMLSMILPNNRQALRLLDVNRKHLSTSERQVLELFRQHVDDLEAKHIGHTGDVASRFPAGMESILLGDGRG